MIQRYDQVSLRLGAQLSSAQRVLLRLPRGFAGTLARHGWARFRIWMLVFSRLPTARLTIAHPPFVESTASLFS